ncbi:rCG44544 [Rattus norvegicus]|uniref:RCG44544 n=1 Tax=Rattus norvegicus TaxID=10116 RepID=A6I517_RAT|nr:rCG44544 [Rattus norvegicus]
MSCISSEASVLAVLQSDVALNTLSSRKSSSSS